MSVYKSFEDLTKVAAAATYNLVHNKAIETDTLLDNGRILVPSILLEPSIIDIENIHNYIN